MEGESPTLNLIKKPATSKLGEVFIHAELGRGNDTCLQTNRIYCHINGLKTRRILITSFEHVLMIKALIFELLLRCHKRTKHFRLSKGLVAKLKGSATIYG